MNREDAIRLLTAGSSHERLKAARTLAKNPGAGDLEALRGARQSETVSYVKTSLDIAIRRLSSLPTVEVNDPPGEIEIPEEVRRQISSKAVEWIAGLLLHEIASPIGMAIFSAKKEIPNYAASETRRHFETVRKIFDAINQLKGATATPKPEEFDLSELVREIVSSEDTSKNADLVSLVGPSPFMVETDPALLRLSIANGLRNAIEAVALGAMASDHAIVINWGRTDVDCWLSILDRGVGIPGPVEPAFEIGKSNKEGHSGFGLAIARQAIETLGGSVTLQSTAEEGTRYAVRWE